MHAPRLEHGRGLRSRGAGRVGLRAVLAYCVECVILLRPGCPFTTADAAALIERGGGTGPTKPGNPLGGPRVDVASREARVPIPTERLVLREMRENPGYARAPELLNLRSFFCALFHPVDPGS